MTNEEWDSIALLLAKGWKGDFGPGEDRAYRVLLDGYSAEDVTVALRKLVAHGHHAIPSVTEIVQAIERDETRPTFAEVFSALYDASPLCGGRGVFWTRASNGLTEREARLERAWAVHPLVGAFVESYGLDRLAMLEVDGEKAGIVRRDLEQTWDRFVEANEHRDAAALAAGYRRKLTRGPRKVDFLDAVAAGGLVSGEMESEGI